jgi:hypothetical protein
VDQDTKPLPLSVTVAGSIATLTVTGETELSAGKGVAPMQPTFPPHEFNGMLNIAVANPNAR